MWKEWGLGGMLAIILKEQHHRYVLLNAWCLKCFTIFIVFRFILLLLLTSFDCFGECDSKGLASLQLLIEVSTRRS